MLMLLKSVSPEISSTIALDSLQIIQEVPSLAVDKLPSKSESESESESMDTSSESVLGNALPEPTTTSISPSISIEKPR